MSNPDLSTNRSALANLLHPTMERFIFIEFCAVLLTANSYAEPIAELVIDYCNDTRCSNFRNFTYNETDDLLNCECFPGWIGPCCQLEDQCAYGDFDPSKSACSCWDRHYSGDRCDVVSCENDGLYEPVERWAYPNATGCTCFPGTSGRFCEIGQPILVAGRSSVRVRITTTSFTRAFSSWSRPSSSRFYFTTDIHPYGYGFNPHWLWLLLLIFFIIVVIAVIYYKNGCCEGCTNNSEDTIVTKTVLELNMPEEEADDLLRHPEKAAFYTGRYHHPPMGDTQTTTEIEVFKKNTIV